MQTFEISDGSGTYEISAPDLETATATFKRFRGGAQQQPAQEADPVAAWNARLQANLNSRSRLGQMDGPASGAENLLQSLTFNRADDVARFFGADEFADNINTKQEAFRESHPKTALMYDVIGSGMTTATGAAGLTKVAPKLATMMNPTGKSFMKRVGIFGTAGGVQSGLYSSGEEEANAADVAASTLIGGTIGGALGGGVPVAGRLIKGGYNKLTGKGIPKAERKAAKYISDALEGDNVSPGKAANRMERADTMLLNTGDENLIGLGRAVSAKPGRSRGIMNTALDAQQKASGGKLTQIITDTLGGGDMPFNTRVAKMITKRSKSAQKAYDGAFKANFKNGHPIELDVLADKIPPEALRNAQNIARAEGRPFGEQLVASIDDVGGVKFSKQPSIREWHYIQRGLRGAVDSAYRQGAGEVGTAYKSLHKELLRLMDKASPGYKLARQHYATESQLLEALARGRNIMKPSQLANIDALADDFASMSKPEKEMIRLGLSRGLEDMITSTPDTAGDVVRKVFGTPQKREAIKTVFPSDGAFRMFQAQMMRMAKEASSFKAIRTGSRTAFVDAEKDNLAGKVASAGVDIAQGNMFTGALRFLTSMFRSKGMDEQTAAEIAKMLTSRDPNRVRAAMQAARVDPNQLPPHVRAAIPAFSQASSREAGAPIY